MITGSLRFWSPLSRGPPPGLILSPFGSLLRTHVTDSAYAFSGILQGVILDFVLAAVGSREGSPFLIFIISSLFAYSYLRTELSAFEFARRLPHQADRLYLKRFPLRARPGLPRRGFPIGHISRSQRLTPLLLYYFQFVPPSLLL